ncbi:SMP-30/gluconolactonase/LRE family protein [Nannocystis bainbridge]|uniref:SMP-30/gluconolactonase/LRE family protein n=1 Tax=Nannocystis bainbridge TaxID=2995303 RepID=A0ABT5E6I9_9BACT|nr:SMP-30/gluconolactonase/LRE family protein [Nannocystis bainbridge]MDC0720422.1 SMP-30/gluconolactonase/LRE family protein [Nannocystis bainbridge]
MRRLLLLAILATACTPRGEPAAPAGEPAAARLSEAEMGALTAAYGQLGAALGRQEFAAGLVALDAAAAIDVGDPALEYLRAAVLAAAGREQEALAVLGRLDAAGSLLVPQAHDFPGLVGPALERLAAAARARLPASPSVRAFTLADRALIPEGIAHDPGAGTFFVGSIHKRKIVAVERGGAARDLAVADATNGLYSPLGMKFDRRRGSLWVASAGLPEMQGFVEAEHRGRAALHELDPSTGRSRARYPRESPGRHLLNDLVIAADGALYLTDSEAGEVLRLRPGPGAQFEVVAPAGEFAYPNGIALSDDGGVLFVADFVRGLTAIPLATRRLHTLPHPRGVATHGFDGLDFHRGALVGIDNSAGGGRIVQLTLAAGLDRIVAARVLEAGHPDFHIPTTGVLDGDSLVYIANSQLRSFAGGQIFPHERLSPVQVLRLPLR